MIKLSFVFVFIFAFYSWCFSQNSKYGYRKVPDKYLQDNSKIYLNEIQNVERAAYDLTKSLPRNFVKDGSVNYTRDLQRGINLHSNVIMPDFPVLIDGLYLKSNSNVVFRDHSKLIMAATNKEWYGILKLYDVNNINIYNAKLVGDRFSHIGNKGEWGFGIDIRCSGNINIIQPNISNCWGDGIFISRSVTGTNLKFRPELRCPHDILIVGGVIDNNRRDGISVINVNGLKIDKTVIANTHGTSPNSGIDIEPDYPGDDLTNISLNNIVTFNNAWCGIQIHLANYVGSKPAYTNINIENHTDLYSSVALNLTGFKDHYKSNVIGINGKINIFNPKWIHNSIPLQIGKKFGLAPLVSFKNVQVLDLTKNGALIKKVNTIRRVINEADHSGRIKIN